MGRTVAEGGQVQVSGVWLTEDPLHGSLGAFSHPVEGHPGKVRPRASLCLPRAVTAPLLPRARRRTSQFWRGDASWPSQVQLHSCFSPKINALPRLQRGRTQTRHHHTTLLMHKPTASPLNTAV